ncbi:MAG: hypothetical protein EZS28_015654, partial [Streblomastix strix]
TKLDLKSSFHHLTVYEPHRPYLAFEMERMGYRYREMPFGTQHSTIFFSKAMNKMKRRKFFQELRYEIQKRSKN